MNRAHAIANLRHLYGQMVSGQVKDTEGAARGLLGPAIEALESVMNQTVDAVSDMLAEAARIREKHGPPPVRIEAGSIAMASIVRKFRVATSVGGISNSGHDWSLDGIPVVQSQTMTGNEWAVVYRS